MRRAAITAVLGAAVLAAAWGAVAQAGSLWLKEAIHEETIYVFNTPEAFTAWQTSHALPTGITKAGWGPKGEKVVFENQMAVDLYNLRHGKDSEVPPAKSAEVAKPPAKPPAPALPTALKIGDEGEVRLSSLLQVWYVADDSKPGTGTGWWGNTTGKNTFRVRRAEIKLSGKATPAWGFELMADFAKSQTPTGDNKILQDVAVSYLGLKGHELAIGQKKIALTDESLRSSADLDFAERAMMTRTFSDARQIGLFYKGAWGRYVGATVSVTNGTLSNVSSDTNDTVLMAGKLDIRPVPGLVFGGSGGTGAVDGGMAHRDRTRIGAHLRYDGPESFPLGFRAELVTARDEQANGSTLDRDGWYASVLYTFAKKVRLGFRWDEMDTDTSSTGGFNRIVTCGFQYFPVGKYANVRLEYEMVEQDGRMAGSLLEENYDVFLLAVQASF